jgi:hypothetical protein
MLQKVELNGTALECLKGRIFQIVFFITGEMPRKLFSLIGGRL